MGKMALTKGSELHLLRFLGRHRKRLNTAIRDRLMEDTGQEITSIKWLDVHFDPKNPQNDGEWKGMDFLDDNGGEVWQNYWPDPDPGRYNRIGAPNWDAVARIKAGSTFEYLLVEAKANVSEIANVAASCGAGGDNREQIENNLHKIYTKLGGNERLWGNVSDNWLGDHYQKGNRLACLYFLNDIVNKPARLLYIYFMGDLFHDSPRDQAGWDIVINNQYQDLGIERKVCTRSHELFINVIYENE